MASVEAHFEHLPRDPIPRLDRLVGIRIGPHRNRLGAVFGFGQRGAQQIRRVGLGEEPGLEIQPWRQVVIGMRGPREAVNAAVLAAAIGVDRPVEGHVGRLVEAEDRLRVLLGNLRAQFHRRAPFETGQLLYIVAPVAIHLARSEAEARGHLGTLRTATGNGRGESAFHGQEHTWNKRRGRDAIPS